MDSTNLSQDDTVAADGLQKRAGRVGSDSLRTILLNMKFVKKVTIKWPTDGVGVILLIEKRRPNV